MIKKNIHSVHIFCDGGLGNRMNSLMGGILLADKTGGKPIVYWPINNWCQCQLSDLFETSLEIYDHGINKLWEDQLECYFMVVENPTKLIAKNYLDTSIESVEFIQQNKINVVYMHYKPPNFATSDKFVQILSNFKICKSIKEHVLDFIDHHKINKQVHAVHIRKTDSVKQVDETLLYYEMEKNTSQRYFVCSDDRETEIKFSKLANVIIHDKKYYVEKMVEGSWNEKIIDDQGRIFNYNVLRSKNSVIEALQDILILSRCKLVKKLSKSTFYQLARLYSEVAL